MMLALAAPRRARQRRYLAAGMPAGPGVYVMRDRLGQALYVGKAGDLRTRVRSYFGVAPPAAAHRGRARRAGRDRRGAHRIRARGRARRARSDPPLAAARQCPRRAARQVRLPAAGAGRACAGARPAHRGARRRRGLRGPVPVSPAGDRGGRGAARRLPAAHAAGRACPWTTAGCLRGAAGRCLAHCRGGDDALAYRRARRAPWRPGWPASEAVRRRAAARARRAPDRAAALRGREAHDAPAGRAARRRRPGLEPSGAHAVAPASCWRPISIRATSSPSRSCAGALVGKRRLPRAGRPGARARRRRRAPSSVRSTRLRRSSRAPRAPGCRRSGTPRRSCSRRPSPGARRASCPSPAPRRMRSALKRVAAARRRVPLREPLPPGRHPRAPTSSRRVACDGPHGGSLTGVASSFRERLERLAAERRSVLCVGLDPRPELFPDEVFRGVRDGPAGTARARGALLHRGSSRRWPSTPSRSSRSSAFFEQAGPSRPGGGRARARELARERGLLVVVDGKRGDIGSTRRGVRGGVPRAAAARRRRSATR